jgi:hypothetical protein
MSYKPTNKVCITKIGMQRKHDRMVAQELAKRFPLIYEELSFEAEQFIAFDQQNPYSTVVDANPPDKKKSGMMRAVKKFKAEQREQALNEKFVPKFYGILKGPQK